MAVSRAAVVDGNFTAHVRALSPGAPRDDLDAPVTHGTTLSARQAIRLFEAQIESRHLDLLARELKGRGFGYYTIGSSGHEGNAAVGAAIRSGDMAFLHYRSGAFFCARAASEPGPAGPFDVIRGILANDDEAIAGGRHKVFGSVELDIPPQTSTIASHLPKALGFALSLNRRARLEGRKESRIAVCTFGDASANHATAVTALHGAQLADFQHVPVPALFVCEDNGIGISTRTPDGWIAQAYGNRPHLRYFSGDGLWLPSAWDASSAAVAWVREHRRPAFLHLRTVRLLGHAGSDVEQLYRTPQEIESAEARDPLLTSATLLVEGGWMSPDDVLALYEDTRARFAAMAEDALLRPQLQTAEAVMVPLYAESDAARIRPASDEARKGAFGTLPEHDARPRHLAVQINRTLTDLFLAEPKAILLGEDVAKKGGVYHVTADLMKRFGVARVFNTPLDETNILGLAIGAGHAGLLPFPEIQYLAYLMNAFDQLRGEAGSMRFFSNGQYTNPMVVRIAGLAYQKGFGGHFHNDNGVAAVREIPGVLVGVPARGADAARMLRTMAAQAREHGRVCVFLEPIALYMTKDLHADGDGAWLTPYPTPDDHMPLGEVGMYGDDDPELTVATFANGLFMSLRVAERLRAEGRRVRVIDLRWLQPLPIDALVPHARASGRVLVVDECRRSSGIADAVVAELIERDPTLRLARVTGRDTYIPLGDAANTVLVQEHDVDAGARALLEVPCAR